MGFSDITSQIIMFIAVITIATGLVIVFNSNIQEASASLRMQSNSMTLSMRTDITIDMVSHNSDLNITYVYIRNTGRTELNQNNTDVYINGLRVPRNNDNRSIELLPDTDLINPGIWDPSEQILIKVYASLENDRNHKISIISDYDGRADKKFTVA